MGRLGRRRAGATLGAVTVAAGVLAGGCRSATIRLAFDPRPGQVYRYTIKVTSLTTTRLTGRPADTRRAVAVFHTTDTVLTSGPAGTLLRVTVNEAGRSPVTYDVRVDRQAALRSIDTASGGPVTPVAGLALGDLVPVAVGPPPDRALHPGDRWRLGQAVVVAGAGPSTLAATGRLDALGVLNGRPVAFTRSTDTVDLSPPAVAAVGASGAGAPVGLRGRETTTADVARDVGDGAIERTRAVTLGRFDILLGTGAPPVVTGTLELEVHSTTTREG